METVLDAIAAGEQEWQSYLIGWHHVAIHQRREPSGGRVLGRHCNLHSKRTLSERNTCYRIPNWI
ncbi:hypothetical protein [Sphaerothrix gracilis]|uniref:hypothetical protein n=1 Tax=Sphaerothrix gracilis TaxID=3151835 RepID=UPI0031FCB8BC